MMHIENLIWWKEDGTPLSANEIPEYHIVESELRNGKRYVTNIRAQTPAELHQEGRDFGLEFAVDTVSTILIEIENDFPNSKKIVNEIRKRMADSLEGLSE